MLLKTSVSGLVVALMVGTSSAGVIQEREIKERQMASWFDFSSKIQSAVAAAGSASTQLVNTAETAGQNLVTGAEVAANHVVGGVPSAVSAAAAAATSAAEAATQKIADNLPDPVAYVENQTSAALSQLPALNPVTALAGALLPNAHNCPAIIQQTNFEQYLGLPSLGSELNKQCPWKVCSPRQLCLRQWGLMKTHHTLTAWYSSKSSRMPGIRSNVVEAACSPWPRGKSYFPSSAPPPARVSLSHASPNAGLA